MDKRTIANFKGDELAATVFEGKYALRNENDVVIEFSLNDVWRRMLKAIKEIDNYDFSELQDNFIPAGRVLYALGNPYDKTSTLSNCYVTDIEEDSIEGIFDAAKRQARIFSKGGGVGIDISKLRPKGAKVNNSAKTTTGAVSFMDLFSQVTGLIGQHGRRGALLLSMDITHPDIIEYIRVKGGKDKTKVQFANISVKITNEFMKAVENDDEWEMIYHLEDENKVIKKTEKAKVIWDLIVESNYAGAEPGLLYWDAIIDNDPSSVFEETKPISTNPCGEIPIEKGGACNLGSVNLSSLVHKEFTDKAYFDFDKFKTITKSALRFLDNINIINLDRQPLQENKDALINGNRIGLGMTGLADMLIKLNLKYDTNDSVSFVSTIMKKFKQYVLEASIDLSIERGPCEIINKYKNTPTFDNWVAHHYFNDLTTEYKTKLKNYGIRNISQSALAPAGSISIILQGTSGIEPIFALSYDRKVKSIGNGKEKIHTVYHPLVQQYNNKFGKNKHLQNPNFVTAQEIDWMQRIKMQSVIQENISSSISSTINLPHNISKEVVSNIYKEAWKHNLKGITIYRDGSRDGILTDNKDKRKDFMILDEVKMPETQNAIMKTIKSEGKKWYVTYTVDTETKLPNSLFVNTNAKETTISTNDVLSALEKLAGKFIKNGHLEKLKEKHNSQTNVTKIARTVSLLLRHRVPIIDIVKTIDTIEPPIFSFIFQIKKLLSSFLEGEFTGEKCSDCGAQLIFEGGCSLCYSCGSSKCG